MSRRAKILDYTALVNLRDSLKVFSVNIGAHLDDVERELNDILQMMRDKIEILRQEMEHARERLERAEAARYRCEASQRYDEENHCYRPSCDLERAAERMAKAKYEEAKRRYETAERIYKDVDYEVSQYLKPFGAFLKGGAADYLRIEGSRLEEADDKMMAILDIVEQILGSKMSPEGSDTSPTAVNSKLTEEAEEKKNKFIDATRDVSIKIEEQEKDDVYSVDIKDEEKRQDAINEFNRNKCPYCGRPLKICICGRGQRERER